VRTALNTFPSTWIARPRPFFEAALEYDYCGDSICLPRGSRRASVDDDCVISENAFADDRLAQKTCNLL